jgi:hypothetical protein
MTSPTQTHSGTQQSGPQAVASQAADQARSLADEATTAGKDLAREARDQFMAKADEESGRAADALHKFGGQLQRMSSAGEGLAADLASEAGSRVDSLASRLQREGLDGIIEETKRFARQRPGVFLAGALLLGAAAARLFKATDTRSVLEGARTQGNGSSGMPYGSRGMTPQDTASYRMAGEAPVAPAFTPDAPPSPLPDPGPQPVDPRDPRMNPGDPRFGG